MKAHVSLCIALMLCQLVGHAEAPRAAQQKNPVDVEALTVAKRSTVCLSEIYPMPTDATTPTWVELYNDGDAAVDIAGWSLHDTHTRIYTFPAHLPHVPAHGVVLVIFQGPQSPAQDDLDFTGDQRAVLYAREDAALTACRGHINQCALARGADVDDATLMDYACWGKLDPLPRYYETALRIGMWEKGPKASSLLPGWSRQLTPGSSLARSWYALPRVQEQADMARGRRPRQSSWSAYPPKAINPGQPNPLPPPSPIAGVGYDPTSGNMGLGVMHDNAIMALPKPLYELFVFHYQIATDEDFHNIYFEERSNTNVFNVILQEGMYYVRVRYELTLRAADQGAASPWAYVGKCKVYPR